MLEQNLRRVFRVLLEVWGRDAPRRQFHYILAGSLQEVQNRYVSSTARFIAAEDITNTPIND